MGVVVYYMNGSGASQWHKSYFSDELPEFQRQALEVLRQPLEDRHITVSRILNRWNCERKDKTRLNSPES